MPDCWLLLFVWLNYLTDIRGMFTAKWLVFFIPFNSLICILFFFLETRWTRATLVWKFYESQWVGVIVGIILAFSSISIQLGHSCGTCHCSIRNYSELESIIFFVTIFFFNIGLITKVFPPPAFVYLNALIRIISDFRSTVWLLNSLKLPLVHILYISCL